MLNAVSVTELAPPPGLEQLRGRYRAFMEAHVYPNEAAIGREDDAALELVDGLRSRAKADGLWAPHLPPEAGGTGTGFLAYAYLNEEIGRSAWAQYVFGCQAPDAGNAEILWHFGTDEQKERWLAPLVAGEIRSFFSMTEPEVSGSDPTSGCALVRCGKATVGDRRAQVVLVRGGGRCVRDRDGGHRSGRAAARAGEISCRPTRRGRIVGPCRCSDRRPRRSTPAGATRASSSDRTRSAPGRGF
jgi:hypothetical protein